MNISRTKLVPVIHRFLVVGAMAVAAGTGRADPPPVLPIGTSTNLHLAAGETVLLALPVAAGTTYVLDVVATSHVAVTVTGPGDMRIGQALDAYGATFTAADSATYDLSVTGDGSTPASCRVAVYTNALPFHRPATPEDTPDFMANPWYEGAHFGHVFVPADRSPGNRHAYRLSVLQMPGGPHATNGPLVYLSGGPGVSSFGGAFLYAAFTNICPVISINQRGAYLSQPNLFPSSPDETTAQLQERLGGPDGIDFHTVNTRQNAADILDVMTALGHHEPFNLWGTSYGTMLAQEVIRQAPDRIRAAVLDGVVTLDQPQWTIVAQSFLDALDALFDDVARHPEASLLYPHFSTQLFELAAALDPEEQEAFFENGVFRAMNLSRWGSVENVPGIVWRALQGESAALAELAAIHPPEPMPPNGGPMSPHMYAAVLRQDMLPFESMETADALTNSIPYPLNIHGHAYSQFQYDFSADWAFLVPTDASFRTPVTNDVPVLVLNGTYDTQTGLAGARHVAEHLPRAYLVELPTIGHAVLLGGEVPIQIARDFLVNPHLHPDTNAVSGLTLSFPAPWPDDAEVLAPGGSLSGSVTNPGIAEWYELSPSVVPAGGISNVLGQLRILQMPDPFYARIYGATDGAPLAQHRGPGTMAFSFDGTPLVLAVQPGSDGEQTGTYEIDFDIPLLVRKLDFMPPHMEFVWQGPTNAPATIQSATHLAATNTFSLLFSNVGGTNALTHQTIPIEGHPMRFFRITTP